MALAAQGLLQQLKVAVVHSNTFWLLSRSGIIRHCCNRSAIRLLITPLQIDKTISAGQGAKNSSSATPVGKDGEEGAFGRGREPGSQGSPSREGRSPRCRPRPAPGPAVPAGAAAGTSAARNRRPCPARSRRGSSRAHRAPSVPGTGSPEGRASRPAGLPGPAPAAGAASSPPPCRCPSRRQTPPPPCWLWAVPGAAGPAPVRREEPLQSPSGGTGGCHMGLQVPLAKAVGILA